ncbi:MAG TPA: MFS transporter [Gaiellaceae bacterium]|nr:MFS transporter [Gaiellaceae bacterium]
MDVRRHPHHGVTFAILALAGMSYALLQSLVLPALSTIQEDLGTTTTAAAWILTAYLLSASVATPIAGRVGDMFGKKRTFVVVLAILAVGTFISAIATTIGVMIVGRVIQGASGAIFPLAFGIIRDEFPVARRAGGIALISAILGAGGGLGIVLSGPITENLSYHWLFWIPLIAIVIAMLAAWIVIPESPVRTPGHVNVLAATLLSGWLVALLLGISDGSSWGWTSTRVLGLFVAAAVLLVAWIRVESGTRQPLVDMRMMRIRGVWTTNLAALLIGFGMYSSFILIPQFVETPSANGYGFSASVTQGGLFLLPSTIAMILVSPLAGRLAGIVGSRVPLIAGSVVSAASFLVLAFAHEYRWELYLATLLLGVGIGLAFAAMANLIVDAVPPQQTGVATGMNTIMRTIGGALGAEIAVSILAASPLANDLPSDHGYTLAFAVSAISLFVAAGAALLVPRPKLETLDNLEHAPALVFEAPEAGS